MHLMKKMAGQLRAMSRPAYLVLEICLIVSILYLTAALCVLIYAGHFSAATYNLYHLAEDLYTMPQALLIIAAVGCSILERAAKN